jgi:nucleoside-diphosphate-sugar epimerase
MGTGARATAFVTDPVGFIGTELVKFLVAGGHQVFALTASGEMAECVRRVGATAVMGDLRTPSRWQDEAAADWVFHLSPQSIDRVRVGRRRSESVARSLVLMDSNLLDAVAEGATRRVVYVANMGCYGAVGARPVTEDEPPRPSVSGKWLLPALDRVEGYGLAGLPIVTAVPGYVYGNGSWFRELVIEPVLTGRRVLQFGTTGPLVSPIHVHDCVRALVHLVEHGGSGGRYFLANSEPARFNEFANTFARIADRPLRVRRLPAAALRVVIGSRVPGGLQSDAVFSNIRLRGTGFRFEFSTLEQGLRQVLATCDARHTITTHRGIEAPK